MVKQSMLVDIELAKKVAKDNHLKLKIVNMQFDSLLGALKTGKIDVLYQE